MLLIKSYQTRDVSEAVSARRLHPTGIAKTLARAAFLVWPRLVNSTLCLCMIRVDFCAIWETCDIAFHLATTQVCWCKLKHLNCFHRQSQSWLQTWQIKTSIVCGSITHKQTAYILHSSNKLAMKFWRLSSWNSNTTLHQLQNIKVSV